MECVSRRMAMTLNATLASKGESWGRHQDTNRTQRGKLKEVVLPQQEACPSKCSQKKIRSRLCVIITGMSPSRQAVRQRFLVPPCPGSNPAIPARFRCSDFTSQCRTLCKSEPLWSRSATVTCGCHKIVLRRKKVLRSHVAASKHIFSS